MNSVFITNGTDESFVKFLHNNLLKKNYYGKITNYNVFVNHYSDDMKKDSIIEIIDSMYYKLLKKRISEYTAYINNDKKLYNYIHNEIKTHTSIEQIIHKTKCPPYILKQFYKRFKFNENIENMANQMLDAIDFTSSYKVCHLDFTNVVVDYLEKHGHNVTRGYNGHDNIIIVNEPAKPDGDSFFIKEKPIFWCVCFDSFLCQHEQGEINVITSKLVNSHKTGMVVTKYGYSNIYNKYENVMFSKFDISKEVVKTDVDVEPKIEQQINEGIGREQYFIKQPQTIMQNPSQQNAQEINPYEMNNGGYNYGVWNNNGGGEGGMNGWVNGGVNDGLNDVVNDVYIQGGIVSKEEEEVHLDIDEIVSDNDDISKSSNEVFSKKGTYKSSRSDLRSKKSIDQSIESENISTINSDTDLSEQFSVIKDIKKIEILNS